MNKYPQILISYLSTASDIFNMWSWSHGALEQKTATFPEFSLLARKPRSASFVKSVNPSTAKNGPFTKF